MNEILTEQKLKAYATLFDVITDSISVMQKTLLNLIDAQKKAEDFFIESPSIDTMEDNLYTSSAELPSFLEIADENVCGKNNSKIILKQRDSLFLDLKNHLNDDQIKKIVPLIENFLKSVYG